MLLLLFECAPGLTVFEVDLEPYVISDNSVGGSEHLFLHNALEPLSLVWWAFSEDAVVNDVA